jgi:chemotaxis response regulator CheB
VSQLRILLLSMPRLLSDMLADAIDQQADMHVVRVDGGGVAASSVREHRPDVVVVEQAPRPPHASADDGPPTMVATLLGEFPALTVMTVEEHGREASLYQLRPHRIPVDEPSPTTLVQLIRRHARAHRETPA